MSILKTVVLLVVAVVVAAAQGPVKLVDGNSAELILAAGGKRYESAMTTATTDTVVTAVTTKVQLIFCKNPEASAQTLTIKDGDGVVYFPAVSMPANSALVMANLTVGLTFSNGVKISSGSSTAACKVVGVQ